MQTLPEYHVVAPVRVDSSGHFLSYGLNHPVTNSRRKRGLDDSEDRVYYRISHEEKDLFFNLTVNRGFLSSSYIVEKRYGNLSNVKIVASSSPPCHLKGTVQQQSIAVGTAVLSACHGLVSTQPVTSLFCPRLFESQPGTSPSRFSAPSKLANCAPKVVGEKCTISRR